ncbi:MAG: zf-HC2 domain-containing protein, partial [Anaerolineae bacterium]
MNCDRVRRLLGVFDEMDRATREAVQQHMAGCGECAMAWADELEFRRLMASRRHPAASPKARTALLAIPPPGARRALMSSRLASFL